MLSVLRKEKKKSMEIYFHGSKNSEEQHKRDWATMTSIKTSFTFTALVCLFSHIDSSFHCGDWKYFLFFWDGATYNIWISETILQSHSIPFISNTTALGIINMQLPVDIMKYLILKQKVVELLNMKATECISLLWGK